MLYGEFVVCDFISDKKQQKCDVLSVLPANMRPFFARKMVDFFYLDKTNDFRLCNPALP